MRDLLDQLNASQREACLTTEGPVLILAGAGSGKTRTITHRIAHLVQQNLARPHEILAVTFTRKAAAEMSSRINTLLPDTAEEPVAASTFHSFALGVLRSCATELGFPRRFSIVDTDDSLELIKLSLQAVTEQHGEEDEDGERHAPSAATARQLRAWISWNKNHGISADDVRSREELSPAKEFDLLVWDEYQRRLKDVGAFDYDDMLIFCSAALDTPVGRAAWVERFKYVLVDEYQDVNSVQHELLRKLAAGHRNLCVVGDDLQSVYRFRGAVVEHILNFERDFPGTRVIKLEDNYRSTPEILHAANSVIAGAQQGIKKTLRANRPSGAPVTLNEFNNATEEAQAIASDIKRQMRAGVSAEEVALIYRNNRQQRILEQELRAAEIPYRVLDGTEFYQRAEIKTACAYLKLIYNPYDIMAFRRSTQHPKRGVGEKTLRAVADYVAAEGASFLDACAELAETKGLRGRAGLAAFADVYQQALAEAGDSPLSLMMERLYHHASLQEYLIKEEGGDDWRWQNVLELMDDARRFDHLELTEALMAFLEHVALQLSPAEEEEQREKVSLLTMHSAKGLEYPHVYLLGLEEAVFKLEGLSEHVTEDLDELEEARRLLYVGVTRAMDRLNMSYAAGRYNRFRGGWNHADQVTDNYPPLRFLRELPEEVRRTSTVERIVRPAGSRTQADRFAPRSRRLFSVGQPVSHPKHGIGTVVAADVALVKVRFDDGLTRPMLPGMIRAV